MNKTKLSTLCLALVASLALPQPGWGCSCANVNENGVTNHLKDHNVGSAIYSQNVDIVFEGRVAKKENDTTIYIIPETIYKGKIEAGWHNVWEIVFCNGFSTSVGQKHFFYVEKLKRKGKAYNYFIPCLISTHSQEERNILEQYLKEQKHGTK